MRSKGYQAIGIAAFFLFSFILCFNSSAQLKVTEVADKVLASNPDLQRTRKKIKQADGLRIQAGSAFYTSYTAGVNKLLNYTKFKTIRANLK
jgi:outer membrane protein TolC